MFKALAHASRRQILLVLHYRGDATSAGDVARRFACSWPTTSRHLKVLQGAGLISVVMQGRERHYRLERERLSEVAGGWLALLAPPT